MGMMRAITSRKKPEEGARENGNLPGARPRVRVLVSGEGGDDAGSSINSLGENRKGTGVEPNDDGVATPPEPKCELDNECDARESGDDDFYDDGECEGLEDEEGIFTVNSEEEEEEEEEDEGDENGAPNVFLGVHMHAPTAFIRMGECDQILMEEMAAEKKARLAAFVGNAKSSEGGAAEDNGVAANGNGLECKIASGGEENGMIGDSVDAGGDSNGAKRSKTASKRLDIGSWDYKADIL